MHKKTVMLLFIFYLGFSLIPLQAGTILDVKMRFYEGVREGKAEPPQFVTSSYLKSTITANIQAGFEVEKESEKIKKVFNLHDISLLTEADFKVSDDKAHQVKHFFRLNSNEFDLILKLIEWKGWGEFVISVNEIVEERKNNVLTTAIMLHGGNIAVFGFEDRHGKPYFISFHVAGPKDKLLPPPPPPPPPRKDLPPPPPPPTEEELEEFAKGAVKAVGKISPPRPVTIVNPIYPEDARKAGVKGYVILGIRVDKQGRVEEAKVLRSIPLLDQAAIDAVRQWKYEPFIFNGKPTPVVFTVTVQFRLR